MLLDSPRLKDNWLKVLFHGGTDLHPLEIIELQEVILQNQKEVFDHLISSCSFYILAGCTFTFISSTPETINFKLSPGRAYLNGVFISLPETYLSCPRDKPYQVSLLLKVSTLEGEAILKDPLLPQTKSFGKAGAKRQIVEAELVMGEEGIGIYRLDYTASSLSLGRVDFLPQAIIDFKQNTLFDNLIEFWKADNEKYIQTGLDLTLNSDGNLISISPGTAYLNGKKVCLNLPYILNLSNLTLDSQRKYFLLLDLEGNISLAKYSYQQVLTLGTIITSEVEGTNIFPSRQRICLAKDLIRLVTRAKEQSKAIAEYQLLSSKDLKADRILTENFATTDGTDDLNYLNTAYVDIFQAQVSLGVTGRSINLAEDLNEVILNKVTIDNAQNSLIEGVEIEEVVQGSLSEYKLLEKNQAPSLKIIPNLVSKSIDREVYNPQNITLTANGLDAELPFIPKINGVEIFNYQLQRGSEIAAGGILPDQSGSIKLTFALEEVAYQKSFISLENSLQIVAVPLYPITEDFSLDSNNRDKSTVQIGDIASSFKAGESELLLGCGLLLELENNDNGFDSEFIYGEVQLVELEDLNEAEILGSGFIHIQNGSNFSNQLQSVGTTNQTTITRSDSFLPFFFDQPIPLVQNKTYALVVKSFVDNLKVGLMDSNNPAINSIPQVNLQSFVEGSLYQKINGQWESVPNQDLSFTLIKYAPKGTVGQITFPLETLEPFNQITLQSPNLPQNNIEFWFKHSLYNNPLPLSKFNNFYGTTQGDLIVKFKHQLEVNNFAFLNLKNITVDLLASSLESNWISKNNTLDFNYDKVEIYLNQITPPNTQVKLYVSSNQGQNWLETKIVSRRILDNNNGYEEVKYTIDNLTKVVEFQNIDNSTTTKYRNQIKFRINFKTENLNNIPYVDNLICVF